MSVLLKAVFLTQKTQLAFQNNVSKKCLLVAVDSTTKKLLAPVAQSRFLASHKADSVPEGRQRVYEGILHRRIRLLKALEIDSSPLAMGTVIAICTFFTFGNPLILHLVTRRYVSYVDYVPAKDSYVAGVYNILAMRKEIEFTPKDVTLPNLSEMMTTCFVKGMPMFISMDHFTDIDHYRRILGFDKPLVLTKENEEGVENEEQREDVKQQKLKSRA